MNIDDELMKAATGDLDDIQTPNQPNQTPPNKISPTQTPLIQNTKKCTKKWLWIIVAIAVIIAVVIIGIFIHNSKNDAYSVNNQSSDYSEDTSNDATQEIVTINPFEAIDKVILDKSDEEERILLKMNSDYKVTNSNFSIEYVGTDDGYETEQDNYLSVKNANDIEIAALYFRCDSDTYVSTGKVTVHIYDDDYGDNGHYIEDEYLELGLQFSSTEYKTEPIHCDYASSADDISSDILDKMKDNATEIVKADYPLATLQKTYFGYDEYGKGNYTYNGIEGWHGGYTNEVKIAFSFTEGGHNYVVCINFYNLKITDDGEICNLNTIEPEIGGKVKSFSELEEDQNENWKTFYEL